MKLNLTNFWLELELPFDEAELLGWVIQVMDYSLNGIY